MKKYFISFRMIISFILVILIFEANGIFSLATTSTLYIPNHHVPAYVYLCDSYELKSDASIETEGITILESGQLVFITEIVEDKEEFWWCKVEVKSEELTLVGYIQREYLVTADQEFLEWERQRAPLSSLLNDDNDVDINYSLDVLEFPESYRESLQALKNQYPNWTFVKIGRASCRERVLRLV